MDLRISVYFHQIVHIFSLSITACFHYNTDFWVDVTSVNFNSKKATKKFIWEATQKELKIVLYKSQNTSKFLKSPAIASFFNIFDTLVKNAFSFFIYYIKGEFLN